MATLCVLLAWQGMGGILCGRPGSGASNSTEANGDLRAMVSTVAHATRRNASEPNSNGGARAGLGGPYQPDIGPA